MRKFLTILFSLPLVLWTCTKDTPQEEDVPNTPVSTVVAVTSVSLDKTTLTLTEGDSFQLTATVKPDNATDKTVVWSSSNTAVANVKDGLVEAKTPGSATVYVKAGEKSASCEVTVNKKVIVVTEVKLSAQTLTLTEGDSETLTATVLPEDATDKTVTWASSDETVASVEEGVVKAIKEGKATITAKAGEKEAECVVTVAKKIIPVSAIELDQTQLALEKGQSAVLIATIKPDDATDKSVTWSSSNTTVASVDQTGKVTALAGGEAIISAKAGEQTVTCEVTVTVPVSSVTLDKTSITLEEDQGTLLTATVLPADATDKTVTWSSSAPDVASVAEGRVTALKEGTAIITAKAGEKTATCTVTVKKKIIAVTSISLNKTTLGLKKGESETLIATVLPNDATDKTVTWSSSNASIASVDQTGKVTVLAGGEATITAKAGEKSATCKVTVTVPVTSVTLDRQSVTLEEDQSTVLTATVNPEDASDKTVTWSSSAPEVASVAEGKVTAQKEGTAIITAKAGEKTATCTVTVKKKIIAVISISLNKTTLGLKKGESETLVATVLPNDATDKTVSWSSSNASIASVDQTGKVTALAGGEATITAKAGEKSATCKVTVTVPVSSVTLDRQSVTLEEDQSTLLTATVLPDDATDKAITWSNSAPDVASVTEGRVTALKEGMATITAKAGEKSATCTVTVKKKIIAVTSISLNKTTLGLKKGESETLVATVLPNDATDKTVSWSSSNSSIASVDQTGKVTALAGGEATITAKAGEKSATCKVTVTVPVTGLVLSENNKTSITVGEKTVWGVKIEPEDATDKSVIWGIGWGNNIASVDSNGQITGLSAGEAYVWVGTPDERIKAGQVITVEEAGIPVEDLEFYDDNPGFVRVGESVVWRVKIIPDDATDKSLVWSVWSGWGDPDAVEVDQTGKITGMKEGTAMIQVRSSNGRSRGRSIMVAPAYVPVESVKLDPTSLNLQIGNSTTLVATVYPSDATDKTVTWSSSNDNVVTVYNNGYIYALGGGQAIITAKAGDCTATCTVSVSIPAWHLDLDSYSLIIEKGQSYLLGASVYPTNTTDIINWSCTNPSVATVDQNGLITAVECGDAVVIAQAGNCVRSCAVTVPAQGISLDRQSLALEEGQSTILGATVYPGIASPIKWTSSDTSVAAVEEGRVTAIKEGSATITATAAGQSATCPIVVFKSGMMGETDWTKLEFYHNSMFVKFTSVYCGFSFMMVKGLTLIKQHYDGKFLLATIHCPYCSEPRILCVNGIDDFMNRYLIDEYPKGVMDGRRYCLNWGGADAILRDFDTFYQEQQTYYPAVTGASFRSSRNGKSLTVNGTLYSHEAGDYLISVFLVEDKLKIKDYYTYADDNETDENVVRMAISNILGDSLIISQDNSTKDFSYSVQIPDDCTDNDLSILVLIHRKYGNQPVYRSAYFGDYYIDNCVMGKVGEKIPLRMKNYTSGSGNEGITVGDEITF